MVPSEPLRSEPIFATLPKWTPINKTPRFVKPPSSGSKPSRRATAMSCLGMSSPRASIWQGQRVPLVSAQGIFKPRVLPEIPLTITTSPNGAYEDSFADDHRLLNRRRGLVQRLEESLTA